MELMQICNGNGIVNTLRIWDAQPIECFSLDSFDKGDYQKAVLSAAPYLHNGYRWDTEPQRYCVQGFPVLRLSDNPIPLSCVVPSMQKR